MNRFLMIQFSCAAVVMTMVFLPGCGSGGGRKEAVSKEPVENVLVEVPAGWFWMGSEEGEQDEKPVHRVWMDSFAIDRYPVTNAQYAVFLLETGRERPLYWNNEKCNAPNQPVVGIT